VMIRQLVCPLAVVFWFVLAPLVALPAQQARDTTTLEPIVVTATRTPVRADRVAARVTVLTAADLRASGARTVAEALDGLAGLTVVQTGSPGSATSVFVRGGESDYVKVLIDGVPLNEPGGAYDFANLTIDNVQRIEVVRGPTSVLYGSDAVSGVVQIFTRKGGSGVRGQVRAGTRGAMELDARLSGGEGVASYSVAAAWRTSDGLYDLNSGFENTTVDGHVHVAPVTGTTADVTLRTVSGTLRYPTDGAGAVVDANQRQLTRATTIGFQLNRRFVSRVLAHVALHSNAIGGGIDDPPDGPADTLGVYSYRSQGDLDRQAADAWVDWETWRGVTLTTGATYEHQRDRGTSESASEYGAYSTVLDATRNNWAGYLQSDIARGPASVTAGVRLDDNERFGTFVTWRVGASVETAFGARAFASAGSAFKEPTFFEQFGGGFVVGNPDLSPERALSWEAGVEQTGWGGRARVSVSYFGQRFRDLVQYSASPVTPAGANYLNVAAAKADGVEIGATLALPADLRVELQYTHLATAVTDAGVLPEDDAAFRLGQPLLRRPANAASTTLRFDGGSVGAYGTLRWSGPRADADFSAYPAARVELPAFATVDLTVEFRPFARWRAITRSAIEVQMRNVFDTRYVLAYGFPMPGRLALVGVRIGG
jgi:vitamin B12 transporter